MSKVFIDALGIQYVGGGRTSIFTLLDHVFRLDAETSFIVLLSAYEEAWKDYPNVEQRIITGGRFRVRLLVQAKLPVWVRQEGADLVHFSKNLGVFGLPCPYIVTVHDLTTLILKDQHTALDVAYWRWVESLTVRHAARVVAVSHNTAEDIERFYGVQVDDITVIRWAPKSDFAPVTDEVALSDLRQRYGLPVDYLLFLGIRAKKKNLPTLLRAFADLRTRHRDIPSLVVVGRIYPQSEDTESESLMQDLGLSDYVQFVGSVPDADLPLFYSASSAYILPSLHEGFGIPCLEAMACGTPVVVTGTGALPEVVGQAAMIVNDPYDSTGLAAAIETVLYDQDARQDLILRGFERISQFSWEKSAREMLNVYYRMMGRQSG